MDEKKKKAQGSQPGQLKAKLSRQMGPALAELFDTAGMELYNSSILALKEDLPGLFQKALEGLEKNVKNELGRQGLQSSLAHMNSWLQDVAEDLISNGLSEVSGAIEDLVSSFSAKFVQENKEEVEESEEETPAEEEAEGVEVVTEEEAEEMAPEEEVPPAEEVTPPEEGVGASLQKRKFKVHKWKPEKMKTVVGNIERAYLEMDDIFGAVKGGQEQILMKAKTEKVARKVIAKVQEKVIKKVAAKYPEVVEVNPDEIDAWIEKNYNQEKA